MIGSRICIIVLEAECQSIEMGYVCNLIHIVATGKLNFVEKLAYNQLLVIRRVRRVGSHQVGSAFYDGIGTRNLNVGGAEHC